MTVTLKVQRAVLVLDESVPLQVTGVVPKLNLEPEGGVQATSTQLPVTVGVYVTVADSAPENSSETVISPGQAIVGVVAARVSFNVTVKLQVAVPPEQVTVVVPRGSVEPDGGLQTTAGV
ncbi:MAG: hypothetical protein AABO57_24285 [Acidobacteriota bacterium]